MTIASTAFLIAEAMAAEAPHGAEKAGGLSALWTDPKWFILYGILAFFFIVHRAGGFSLIAKGLDDRSARIAAELKEAERLRAEAAALLDEYRAKQTAAEAEAKAIVAQAQADAEALRVEAKKELEADLKRREALTAERIKRAESQAQAEVRAVAADAAVAAAERLLKTGLTAEKQSALIADGAKALEASFR